MISKFVREQKGYTQKELCNKLECTEDTIVPIIKKLKEYGVLKQKKRSDLKGDLSDLMDEEPEVVDVEVGANDNIYWFPFVGLIVVAGRVLKCYPKYLLSQDAPLKVLQQVIKVLEKHDASKQTVRVFNETSEESSFNLLAVLLFFIQDYYENGVYSNTENIIETNGSGEVQWDKTVNETFALISNNRPYYVELQTKRRKANDYDYFKRLHECILTRASNELKDADLLDLFEITEVDLTDEELDDFGDKEYILYRIENELSMQFNTRKQLVLKTMYVYLTYNGTLDDIDTFSIFGTNNYAKVWEDVCAEIMDNQLERQLGAIRLPEPLQSSYDKGTKLIELIEKPLWTITKKTANATLIPDLITIKDTTFIIFDAKYYNAQLEEGKTPKGQPGIESITKQYLYQLAYKEFINAHSFAEVRNCFLLPTEEEEVIDKGEVSMSMLSALGLQNIKVRFLPATLAYEYYLSGRKMDISMLNLL